MTRTFLLACLVSCLPLRAIALQNPSSAPYFFNTIKSPPPAQTGGEQDPPEEDESVAPEKFVLNPLEAERNVNVGNQYWRKKKYVAAAKRYERATKYNPSSAEAFFKLGEAQEKLNHADVARACFQKVVDLEPEGKLGSEAKKKIRKMGSAAASQSRRDGTAGGL